MLLDEIFPYLKSASTVIEYTYTYNINALRILGQEYLSSVHTNSLKSHKIREHFIKAHK